MESMFLRLLIFLSPFCCHSVITEGNDAVLKRLEATEKLVKVLSHRVDYLESLEKLHLLKINDLEARDQLQQATIDKLEKEVQEQCQLIESMEETQQATTFELVKQRQVMKSMGESLNRTSIDKTRDISKWSNANLNNGETHSRSTDKERSVIGIRQAEIEAPIAFYAHLGRHNLEHAGIGQIVIYDSVVTNVGNGYSGSSGAFTAPVDGIYVFSSTLVALLHNNVRTSIFKNSDLINYMFAGGVESLLNSSSNTIVLQLNKGDVITVRIADGNSSMQGYESSSFSGFLLSRLSNNQNVIVGK